MSGSTLTFLQNSAIDPVLVGIGGLVTTMGVVVISATFIGVFVGEAVTVMDGRVGRGREADGEVARGQGEKCKKTLV